MPKTGLRGEASRRPVLVRTARRRAFLVAGAVARFAYLQLGLGVLLIGIGGKLVYGELTGDKVPTALTLSAILAVVSASIGASLLKERRRLRAAVG